MAKKSPALPLRVEEHFTTISALNPSEIGTWTKVWMLSWHDEKLTRTMAELAVGPDSYARLAELELVYESHKGLVTFPWLEKAREHQRMISAKCAANGRLGGRGNKRKKGARPTPRQANGAALVAQPAPKPAATGLVLMPPERFSWPKWAGARVKGKWQDFKRARWKKHQAQYDSVEAEQNAIDQLASWYTSGPECHEAIVQATSKEWKHMVSPEKLAASRFGPQETVHEGSAKAGSIPMSKVKECVR